MAAPDRIWLQWHGDGSPDEGDPPSMNEVTWWHEMIFEHDIPYIRQDTLKADIKYLASGVEKLALVASIDPRVPLDLSSAIGALAKALERLEVKISE